MLLAEQLADAKASSKKNIAFAGLKRTVGWAFGLVGFVRSRNSMREMLEFDDAQLADIGLRRSDINAALHVKPGQDPFSELRRTRIDTLRGQKRF